MKVFVTGGTGFVGSHLSNLLLENGHQVIATGTRHTQKRITHENFLYISADTTQPGQWQELLQDVDAVVNLAGKTIFHRWSNKYKKQIYDTRILTTRHLVDALPKDKDMVLCSTSAAGYYGDRGDDILPETMPCGDDFLATVCKDWESEAFQAQEKGVRVAVTRFGVVLGKGGGAMKQMTPAFRMGVGGPLGNGEHWFPWIHITDLLAGILFILENETVNGAINFVGSEPVRQRDFAKTLGHVLNRPAFMPAPDFMIRLVMGELGAAMLSSQRAVPDKLLAYGFNFKYPDVRQALLQIVNS